LGHVVSLLTVHPGLSGVETLGREGIPGTIRTPVLNERRRERPLLLEGTVSMR
jgi:hypothetical protein